MHLVQKGPKRRALQPTPNFPDLGLDLDHGRGEKGRATPLTGGKAQFQDGYPLFLASEDSLDDLKRHVELAARETRLSSADGADGLKWRIGKMDVEKWKDASQLEIERYANCNIFSLAPVGRFDILFVVRNAAWSHTLFEGLRDPLFDFGRASYKLKRGDPLSIHRFRLQGGGFLLAWRSELYGAL